MRVRRKGFIRLASAPLFLPWLRDAPLKPLLSWLPQHHVWPSSGSGWLLGRTHSRASPPTRGRAGSSRRLQLTLSVVSNWPLIAGPVADNTQQSCGGRLVLLRFSAPPSAPSC